MATEHSNAQNHRLIVKNGIYALITMYDDPEREGVRDTPERVARMYDEFFAHVPPVLTTFDANGYDQMIVDSGIPFYSLCEHHIVPFFGTVTIGYLPGKRIVGLSKLARTVDYFARRLQTQEYMTQQIADYLAHALEPQGLGVIVTARHLCREMRGIKKPGLMTTTALHGTFYHDAAKQEFLNYYKGTAL